MPAEASGGWADEVARTLSAIDASEPASASKLLPLVYEELRRRAGKLMAAERAGHTLSATALVHEAFVKLIDRGATFDGRRHFLNAAAQAMRRILVDHARTRGRIKRGGADIARVSLDTLDLAAATHQFD